jgi:twitching motility protein PilT
MNMSELLHLTIDKHASDLHLAVGRPPMLRIDGKMVQTGFENLTPDESKRLIYSVLRDDQKQKFETEKELDFSLSLHEFGRFRVNVHYQRGTVAAAFRTIPSRIPTLEELRLPDVIPSILDHTSGLILVTGPTGSGKSTSLAAMIDYVNDRRTDHIITVEDPIEYLHKHKQCMIEQREIAADTDSFVKALKYVLRQDPDVILIGEMRDLETISAALTAAETGHLVLATLHTIDTSQTIDRVVDVFPPHQQQQIRTQLANALLAVFCQRLLPMASGSGRVAAVEVMVSTSAIATLIREGKTHQILSTLETSMGKGMQTMDRALGNLVRRNMVTFEEASKYAKKPEELSRYT